MKMSIYTTAKSSDTTLHSNMFAEVEGQRLDAAYIKSPRALKLYS